VRKDLEKEKQRVFFFEFSLEKIFWTDFLLFKTLSFRKQLNFFNIINMKILEERSFLDLSMQFFLRQKIRYVYEVSLEMKDNRKLLNKQNTR